MAESNTLTTVDITLRVWAVVGPLIVGGIGAWWSRKNTIEDRDHEDKKLTEEREHQLEIRKAELEDAQRSRQIERRKERLKEKHHSLQEAAIKFLASSHEYVRKQTSLLNAYKVPLGMPNRQEQIDQATIISTQANDEMTHYSQVVILHGDPELSDSVATFWNAVLSIPRDREGVKTEDYQDVLSVYRSSRVDLQVKIKSLLRSYEEELNQL